MSLRSVGILLSALLAVACNGDTGVTKFNSEPVATITSHADGDTVVEGSTVSLRGIISDPDDGAQFLSAAWYAGSRELCSLSPVDSSGGSLCEATLSEGEGEISLEGQDPENAVGIDVISLTVLKAEAPLVTFEEPQATTLYYADQDVDVSVTVTDDQDEPSALTLVWSDPDGVSAALGTVPDEDGQIEGSLSLDEGDYSLTLSATDSSGLVGSATVNFTVGPANSPPSCEILSPEHNGSVGGGVPVTLEGQLSDPDVEATLLSASWASDLDGSLGSSAVNASGLTSLEDVLLSVGTHTLTLSGQDERGGRCTDSILFTVGSPPEVSVSAPSDYDQYNEGESVTFIGAAADNETLAADLEVVWSSSLDGDLDFGAPASDGTISFDTDTLSVGEHEVTLTVTDGDGLYSSASVMLIINGLPSAPGVSISPSAPGTDDTLTASVSSASVDPEGDSISYTYAWTRNGSSTGYSSTTVPSSATSKGEVWAVTVTPNDGWGDGTPGTSSATVGNTAPSLSSVSVTPTSPTEADTLTCTPSGGSDVDGDSVSYSYAWSVNGVLLAASSSTLGATFWVRGDSVVCTVTPSDGTSSGSAVSSSAVTIGNSLPSISSASISPSTAYAGNTLTCSVSGFSDLDGDSDQTTFAWTVNGVSAGSGSTLSSGFVNGNTVVCTATPFDGLGSGTAKTASRTISNTAPVLASVSLTPSSPTSSDTLTCTPGTTTDADGTTSFSYTYAWSVGGATIGATGSTLGPTLHARGDAVRCTVTPSDGTSSGSAVASSSVTIGNTAPTISSVTLNTSSPGTNDTLSATVVSSDTDGDSVSLSYNWYVNGSSVYTGGSSLSGASYFSKGQSVYVSVTPSDSYGSGTAVSSSTATVANTAPTAPVASISPTAPEAGIDNLLCSLGTASTDADGDTISYTITWTKNGSSFTGTTTTTRTNDTVPYTATSAGNIFACKITPSDGSASGTAGTASVTVLAASYTVGNATAYTSYQTFGANTLLASKVTLSSAATLYDIGTIHSYTSGDMKLAVYSDSSGVPGTLLAQTAATTITAGSAQETPISAGSLSLSAGSYWIVVLYSSNSYPTSHASTTATFYYKSNAYSSGFPSSYGSGSTVSVKIVNWYLVVR